MSAQYVKMHDAWLTDPRIQRLLRRQELDAVVLFWGLICHAHAHDSDGFITRQEGLDVARSAHLPDGNHSLRALRRAGLITSVGRTGIEVVRYRKWQTTSDQRKYDAERMRTSRARSKPVHALERDRERKNARAAHVLPQPDEDDADGVVRLGPDSLRVLAELREREGLIDG